MFVPVNSSLFINKAAELDLHNYKIGNEYLQIRIIQALDIVSGGIDGKLGISRGGVLLFIIYCEIGEAVI